MKLRSRFIVLLVLLLGFGTVRGQVTVQANLVNNALEVFFLKDFDINNPSSGPPIFFVVITNTGEARRLILSLNVESQNEGPLLTGETDPFLVGTGQLTLQSGQLFTSSGDYRLVDFQKAEGAIDRLITRILATGKLPSDIYTFEVNVRDFEGSIPPDQTTFEIRVTNPQKLDLILPGRPATGSMRDCPAIFAERPNFQWESEMRAFRVIIAELNEGMDPESALNQEPRFDQVFAVGTGQLGFGDISSEFGGTVEVIPSTAFLYPATNEILNFRPGKTYVWRVEGIVETSSGLVTTESEIFCFQIANFDNFGGPREAVLVLLRTIMGPDFEAVFGEGGELEGQSPMTVRFNGNTIPLSQLIQKLSRGGMAARYNGYRIE